MADIVTGHIKYAPKLFPGAKCNVLKFTLIIDEALGKKVPVVVFGKKADTYSEILSAGDVLRVCGAMKENHYGDSITNELHLGDYGAGYIKKVGRQEVADEDADNDFNPSNCDEIPELFFPEPTDEDWEIASGQWEEPFPRTGFLF